MNLLNIMLSGSQSQNIAYYEIPLYESPEERNL